MNKLQTLYNLLQINRKIESNLIRFMYLRDVWGMNQQAIADTEGCSQSFVSKELILADKKITPSMFKQQTNNLFTGEEIQYLQMLPREVIRDMECLAFITEVLQLHPYHPFFQFYDTSLNVKIAALASMGIQNKRLMAIFNKTQPAISMTAKRYKDRVQTMERPNRYEKLEEYRFQQKEIIPKFRLAGGQE